MRAYKTFLKNDVIGSGVTRRGDLFRCENVRFAGRRRSYSAAGGECHELVGIRILGIPKFWRRKLASCAEAVATVRRTEVRVHRALSARRRPVGPVHVRPRLRRRAHLWRRLPVAVLARLPGRNGRIPAAAHVHHRARGRRHHVSLRDRYGYSIAVERPRIRCKPSEKLEFHTRDRKKKKFSTVFTCSLRCYYNVLFEPSTNFWNLFVGYPLTKSIKLSMSAKWSFHQFVFSPTIVYVVIIYVILLDDFWFQNYSGLLHYRNNVIDY